MSCVHTLNKSLTQTLFWPAGCSKDRVPNIRFNVAKLMEKVAPIVDGAVVEQTIRPCLRELSEDKDGDVRFYAQRALTVCDSQLSM